MADYYLSRDEEIAIVAESTYGTSAGNPVAGDFVAHGPGEITRNRARKDRTETRQYANASVSEAHAGRRSSTWTLESPVIPSGVAGTPTAPDQHEFLVAGIGSGVTRTAHTTTTSGSSGVTLELTAGGGAASGVAVGDLIAVDVDATNGIEVRLVTAVSTDTVTVNYAFSTDPATGRAVYVGTTYKLSQTALNSFELWRFVGDSRRYVIPGCICNEVEFTVTFTDDTPTLMVSYKGMGQPQEAQSISKPTATTQGEMLTPDVGHFWVDGTKVPPIGATLNVKNGLALRQSEGTSLEPTGVKRTDNESRYDVQHTLETFITSDTLAMYTNTDGDSLTSYAAIAQWGNAAGKIVAWCVPDWRPDSAEKEQDGEQAMTVAGRCYSAAADGEVCIGFL